MRLSLLCAVHSVGRDPGPVFPVVAEARERCIDKIEQIEETVYDEVVSRTFFLLKGQCGEIFYGFFVMISLSLRCIFHKRLTSFYILLNLNT